MSPPPPPAHGDLLPPREEDDKAGYWHRQLIGWLGFTLPWLLVYLDRLRPTRLLTPDVMTSVSAFYYSGGVALFVGVLSALAVFLFTYRGYRTGQMADRTVAIVAGTAALGVAWFPTGSPVAQLEPDWWTDATGKTHYTSAVILFSAFAVFSLVLFRRSKHPSWKDRPPDKQIRDTIYLVCGAVILLSMLWAYVNKRAEPQRPIFLPEAVALEAFAISWLVKGRADQTLRRLPPRALHWVKNPRLLVSDLEGALGD